MATLNVVRRSSRPLSWIQQGPRKPRLQGRKRTPVVGRSQSTRWTQTDMIGMDPAVDNAAKPRSDAGGRSPDIGPPPVSVQSLPSDPPPVVEKSVTWSSDLTTEAPSSAAGYGHGGTSPVPTGHNPYIASSPTVTDNQNALETVKNVLSSWGKKVKETAKKAEDLSRNTWQHLKTSPSFTDAAMGRIAQSTKVIAEGGYEKIFGQTFDSFPDEQLRNSYACYLSTSAGPIMGILYVSSAKLAFCGDNPLPYKVGDRTEWSYYKVVIPLHQLRAANPSINSANSAEKYIQIVSADNHEFWFMGFLSYDAAVTHLQEVLHDVNKSQS
ncbi:unnamed protein product [Musa textilis]